MARGLPNLGPLSTVHAQILSTLNKPPCLLQSGKQRLVRLGETGLLFQRRTIYPSCRRCQLPQRLLPLSQRPLQPPLLRSLPLSQNSSQPLLEAPAPPLSRSPSVLQAPPMPLTGPLSNAPLQAARGELKKGKFTHVRYRFSLEKARRKLLPCVTDRVLNDMLCFRGELTLGVHKIPFLEFSPLFSAGRGSIRGRLWTGRRPDRSLRESSGCGDRLPAPSPHYQRVRLARSKSRNRFRCSVPSRVQPLRLE